MKRFFFWRMGALISSFLTLSSSVLLGANAFKFSPVARVSALGGQYYTGTTHSSGANIDIYIVPAFRLHPRLYLVPVYIRTLHQTQTVRNYAGENTLVQIQADQMSLLRADWIVTPVWHIKPRVGYSNQWIKQSSNESLTSGLFNYNRLTGGVAAQAVLPQGSFELGYEYSLVRYPNYHALAADPRLTSTGVTQAVGKDVLDFNSHETSIAFDTGWTHPPWRWSAKQVWVREDFIDHHVISQRPGGFESVLPQNRTDDIFLLTFEESRRFHSRALLSLGESFQYYMSNQNAFDSTHPFFATPFTYRYYNFLEADLNPALTLYLDKAQWELRLEGNFQVRQYTHRRTQDGYGTYQNNLIYQTIRGGTLTLRRKLFKGFYLVLTSSILTASSNTRYEANYPYNYTVWNYLGGLSWER